MKWGPACEVLAGLVETAEAWSSLTVMTRSLAISEEQARLLQLQLLRGAWERKGHGFICAALAETQFHL